MTRFVFCLILLPLGSLHADDPILIAHRGLLRHAPENTLPAFASCLELGMGFELDTARNTGYLVFAASVVLTGLAWLVGLAMGGA